MVFHSFFFSFNNARCHKVYLSHISSITILYVSIGFCFIFCSFFVFNYTNLFECFNYY